MMDVGDNLFVCLKDYYVMFIVFGQLKEVILLCNVFIVFFIFNDKIFLFYFIDSIVMYIDIYCYGLSGVVVFIVEEKEFDLFCINVWELESNDEIIYGNLVFVDF